MFNGMMDPALFKLAEEQMSRMSPAELAKIQQQMMSNPELMRMASESMKNMRPEDLRQAADQLKNIRPEEMAEIGEKMANASPEEIAAVRARADAQMTYEINAAQMLKKEGNELHSQGRFKDASQKYLLAKNNLKGIPSSKGKTLLLACSLNLMSCYLKTRQYEECIKEGSEVLACDAKNVKAFYRRGQAYGELGQLKDAVSDLRKALEISPDDETIAQVLRDAEESLTKEGGSAPIGVVIEEITEDKTMSSVNHENSLEYSEKQHQESEDAHEGPISGDSMSRMTNSESLKALEGDPDAIRSFQNFISNADPTTLAAMGAGNAGEVSPDMIKAASSMIGKMSPEELQKMIQLASSFPGENPFVTRNSDSNSNSFGHGSVPNVSPDMLKTASDMMGKMSPDDLQRMFEMASSLRGKDPSLDANHASSSSGAKLAANLNHIMGESETSSSHHISSSSRNVPSPLSNFPSSPGDMQEQIRNQMKDPAMRQMFTSMMKNMSPEMMANMGEQFGLKLSPEDAAKAQQAMSSLSPEMLDKMMCWADRAQRGVETVKKTKNWLLGRPGMILAISMLLLAVLLHRLDYIGS
ncbi:outer envelope protein 61 [Rhodamnia argentea]|uniref:Outer envelope protein 61 n=1 Tax=Rhodamnia argentea TaxID=178133 RepID=A0A8B8NJ43_9MYRT|nr:outer envelope protein 61 [Rhodamnia argentea]